MPEDQGKREFLRAARSLNPHPEHVSDELFRGDNAFFDPLDLVQVKYEMLRRVEQDKQSVRAAARSFGFSRPAFYNALHAFQRRGLPGLLHERPGPRRRHKLGEEVVAFLETALADDPKASSRQLASLLHERFGLEVHPRSIERALQRRAKGGHSR
jgi:transposase